MTASVGQPQAEILSVTTVGDGEVYAAGGAGPTQSARNAEAFIAKSTDRGATWTELPVSFQGAIGSIASDARGLFVTGEGPSGGFFARSSDGGATWTWQAVPRTLGLAGSWVSAAGEIYVAGWSRAATVAGVGDGGIADGGEPGDVAVGVLVRSSDGGASWSVICISTAVLGAVSGTPDGARLVATGGPATLLESRDRGATWQTASIVYPAGEDTGMGNVWVPDATADAYAAAGSHGLLRVGWEDLGNYHDTKEPIPSDPFVNAVSGSPVEIWAVGGGGLIARKTLE